MPPSRRATSGKRCPHYQGGRGYQPTAVYWVEQDLVVADEYRDGNVGAGMATLPLIQRAFASLPATVTTFYFRADTACYDEPTLKWLADPAAPRRPRGPHRLHHRRRHDEGPARGLRRRPRTALGALRGASRRDRPLREVEFTPGDWPKQAQPLRYVALRIRKKQGQLFALGADTKYLAVVSNRWELPVAQLLRWHWQKAGTIELVHDITKNELGAAVPPCGRFGANAAWYRLSLLTYNVLSALKSLALPPALSAARPKRLRFALFTLAGRLITHAGHLVLRVSAAAEAPRRPDRRAHPARPRRPSAPARIGPAPAQCLAMPLRPRPPLGGPGSSARALSAPCSIPRPRREGPPRSRRPPMVPIARGLSRARQTGRRVLRLDPTRGSKNLAAGLGADDPG